MQNSYCNGDIINQGRVAAWHLDFRSSTSSTCLILCMLVQPMRVIAEMVIYYSSICDRACENKACGHKLRFFTQQAIFQY